MANRGQVTFAKRQREMDKKRAAEEKRTRRAQRAAEGPKEAEVLECRPFVDEER